MTVCARAFQTSSKPFGARARRGSAQKIGVFAGSGVVRNHTERLADECREIGCISCGGVQLEQILSRSKICRTQRDRAAQKRNRLRRSSTPNQPARIEKMAA